MADILLGQSAADTYFTNAYSGYRLKDYSTCAVTDSRYRQHYPQA